MRIHAYHIDYSKYKKMLAIYNSCIELGISVPSEVGSYLAATRASRLDIDRCIRDIGDGYTVVDVKSLPDNVETLVIKDL